MKIKKERPLVQRYEGNPILTRDDVPYPVGTVHNAGVVKHCDRYIMLFRSHTRNGRSIIGKAESKDGFSFAVDPEAFLVLATEGVFAEYEAFGVEDLRNVVIFPQKFGGRYVRLDRPHSEITPWSIWISYSPDLIHWGDFKMRVKPMPYHWDELSEYLVGGFYNRKIRGKSVDMFPTLSLPVELFRKTTVPLKSIGAERTPSCVGTAQIDEACPALSGVISQSVLIKEMP